MTEAEIEAVCEVGQRLRQARRRPRAQRALRSSSASSMAFELINHATFADEQARDALEAAKDWVFVMPTIGISYATLHEASAWGITPEVATSMGVRRELELGSHRHDAI